MGVEEESWGWNCGCASCSKLCSYPELARLWFLGTQNKIFQIQLSVKCVKTQGTWGLRAADRDSFWGKAEWFRVSELGDIQATSAFTLIPILGLCVCRPSAVCFSFPQLFFGCSFPICSFCPSILHGWTAYEQRGLSFLLILSQRSFPFVSAVFLGSVKH